MQETIKLIALRTLNHTNRSFLLRSLRFYCPNVLKRAVAKLVYPSETRLAERCLALLIKSASPGTIDAAIVKEFQNENCRRILSHALKYVPFYRNLLGELNPERLGVDSLHKFPIVSKLIFREQKDAMIADCLDQLNYVRFNTGGSTAEPFEFLVSKTNGFVDSAHQEYAFRLMGYRQNDGVAAFDGIAIETEKRCKGIYWCNPSNEDLPYGKYHYSALYLNDMTAELYLRHIEKTKPRFLRGYPSALCTLADYMISNQRPLQAQIAGIQLTAEQSYDWQIELIERAFDAPVYLQYGHSEMCVYAYTYDNTRQYICSPFYGIVEVLDQESGAQVGKGELGEVVVTSFYNLAMPFIRYKTGDLAIYDGVENGCVRLRRIEGREQDVVYSASGNPVSITALVFGGHLKAFSRIQKWQLIQSTPGIVSLVIKPARGFSDSDVIEIQKRFRDVAQIEITVTLGEHFELTPRGKFRFVINRCVPPYGEAGTVNKRECTKEPLQKSTI